MTPPRSTTSLGAILDRTRWDYAPRDRSATDLLSPAGSLFSTVPWDQSSGGGGGDETSTAGASRDDDLDQDVVTTLR